MEPSDTQDAYVKRLEDLTRIVNDFLHMLQFIVADSARDVAFWDRHLLSHTVHDIVESSFAIIVLSKEGMSSVARREFRYLIELAIKVCYVEQSYPTTDIEEKVRLANKVFDSSDIGIKRHLKLNLLPSHLRAPFCEELGRLYGEACNWVHLTSEQVTSRADRLRRGVSAGREGIDEFEPVVLSGERCFAAIIVLLLHAVPEWVAGDMLVNSDGSTHQSHFQASRFVAAIDEHFDYKHERKHVLSTHAIQRASLVRF